MTTPASRPRRPKINQPTPNLFHVLLPLRNLAEAKLLLPLAELIVQERQGQLTLLLVVSVPTGEHLSESAHTAIRLREALSSLMSEQLQVTAQVITMARAENQVWQGIWKIVAQEKIDLLLLSWTRDFLPETVGEEIVAAHLDAPPCEVVVVRPAAAILEDNGWQSVKRILLPVRGGPYAGLALRISNSLAQGLNATITLLHATDQAPRESEKQLLAAYEPALRSLERLKRSTTVVVDKVSDAIIEEAPEHQIVVLGAPTRQVQPGSWSSPLLDAVIVGTDTTLIIVKEPGEEQPEIAGRPPTDLTREQRDQAETIPMTSRRHRPVAVLVDEWFAENTFHSREFADLERLMAVKESQGLSISLGLPALNEAATVGNVIKTLKTALMEEVPLLDEMVLIDSGSVDYTREIASEQGIPVYIHQDILPQYSSFTGKGEALWKSLYVLKGDIIAWVDTDIKNIHPRFVYGVLGPLLRDPRIQYVKGFYRRPLREGDKLVAGGGGRVTELTARPFINLFFPELSGLIQPLSGEYAGRRRALERMPFFSGYGVETGLLIDILDSFGLPAIAQVDLLERIHHNQPLPSLSQMSFAIMQVVFSRLEKRHNINLMEASHLTMNLVRYGPRRYFLETVEIRERERPPMLEVPEYRARRGLEPSQPDAGNPIPNDGYSFSRKEPV